MSAGRSTESGYWSGKLGKVWSIALVCSSKAAGTVTVSHNCQLYTCLCVAVTSFSCHTLQQLALPQEVVGSDCSTCSNMPGIRLYNSRFSSTTLHPHPTPSHLTPTPSHLTPTDIT